VIPETILVYEGLVVLRGRLLIMGKLCTPMKKNYQENIWEYGTGTPGRGPGKIAPGLSETGPTRSPLPGTELVIGCALEELEPAEQQQIRTHLLTCRDCLELFLDCASGPGRSRLPGWRGTERLTPRRLLDTFGRRAQETLQALGKPRRLIPGVGGSFSGIASGHFRAPGEILTAAASNGHGTTGSPPFPSKCPGTPGTPGFQIFPGAA